MVFSKIDFDKKYGKLKILEEVESKKQPNGKTRRFVRVLCDCGEVAVKSYNDVKHGKTQSCGKCKRTGAIKDISGLVSGRITVVSLNKTDNGKTFWNCECDCGEACVIEGERLRYKRVHNCGMCGTKLGSYCIGDILTNKRGEKATVVEIKGKTLGLLFENGTSVLRFDYSNLRVGAFKNPEARVVFGVGYYGIGNFVSKVDNKHTPEYEDWYSMLRRCFDVNQKTVQESYKDVTVKENWHNFQNFAKWATTQLGFGNKGWHLDKDLLVKHNRIYSEDTCVYIPPEINSFIKRKRINDLPIGVDLVSRAGGIRYRAQSRENGSNIHLGDFVTKELAFYAYKNHKEMLAKRLANKWKGSIDERAYQALMNYTVDITD